MIPIVHATIVQVILAVGILGSIAYSLIVLYSAIEFFGSKSRGTGHDLPLPTVTILKPLKGLDPDLYENLSTFCRQDYPNAFQLIFGVADPTDPAIAAVRQLQTTYPTVAIDLVIDSRVYGTNYKVSNLHNMYAHARHDVILIADSDIRVEPDYLRRVVAPLRDPAIGIVSCLYKAVRKAGLPTLIEALFINTDFAAMVMAARIVEKPSYAFGATMAMRRETLDSIGGFLSIRNYLADDYYLGHRVAARGLVSVLSDVVVETVLDVGSWRRLAQHQVRWARTYRTVRPGGYFGSIFTHATLWSVLNLLYSGFSSTSVAIAAGVVALRVGCASALCFRYLGTDNSLAHMLLVPIKDLFISAVWLASFLGNTIKWSGHDFRVLLGGEMVHVTAPSPRPAWEQPPLAETGASVRDTI